MRKNIVKARERKERRTKEGRRGRIYDNKVRRRKKRENVSEEE